VVSKRLTKQEIREDRVAVAAAQAYDYARRNARLVLGGVAIVIVALIVALLMAQGRARSEKQANAGMAQAQSLYFSGDFTQAATQFQALADRYGSAPSARLARMFQGNALLAGGNAAAAEQAFRKFDPKSDPLLQAALHRGLAGSLAGQGKAAEAAGEYEKAAKVPGNLLASDDWLNAGRTYEQAGQTADAARAFRIVVDQYPQSAASAESHERLQEVTAR
jgi:TolA-binding protein